DIAVASVTTPASVTKGNTASVTVMVENMGNQNVAADISVTLADVTDGANIGTQTLAGGLVAGASATLTYSWDTSGATIGQHTLTASQNFPDSNASNDANSTSVNVIAPGAGVTVSSVTPNIIQSGSTVNVTIAGSGFLSGAAVTFENGAGPAPSAASIIVLDLNTITANVSTKAGGPRRARLWDVRVTNTDGSTGVLIGGLTVLP
ncbi:MAG: CARDB domain-containing protein, partial [Dehalococcoidia bacterium]|nr:CARDB domain-containing protein [Dehalococcoidia bacterium]